MPQIGQQEAPLHGKALPLHAQLSLQQANISLSSDDVLADSKHLAKDD